MTQENLWGMHVGIVIVGAGVAGLTASLALARDGNDVVLLERDGFPEEDGWTHTLDEARPGCPQLNQGHSFLARAFKLMESNAPDVLDAMIADGGLVTDGNLVLPPENHDPELRALAIRRAQIDEVLLAAVKREPRVRLEGGTVASLEAGPERDGIHTVTGVRTADGRTFDAELVVDASGRRSDFPALLADIGARPPTERTVPAGLFYYGLYMEILPGAAPPPLFAPVLIRNTLGYLHYAVFVQGAGLLILGLSPEADDPEMRSLRSAPAFLGAWRSIRHIAPFADESFARPVSNVVSMGGLQNLRRNYVIDGKPVARGVAVIGDGLCHTDPTPAYGMSMAMAGAFALPSLVRSQPDGIMLGIEEQIGDELDERYDHVVQANAERMAFAKGRPRDLASDVEFIAEAGPLLLAREEPDALRRFLRRVLAVDRPSVLTDDADFMSAARGAIERSGLLQKDRKPSREELLRIMADADQEFASNSSR